MARAHSASPGKDWSFPSGYVCNHGLTPPFGALISKGFGKILSSNVTEGSRAQTCGVLESEKGFVCQVPDTDGVGHLEMRFHRKLWKDEEESTR